MKRITVLFAILFHQCAFADALPVFSTLLGPVRANAAWKHARVAAAPNGDVYIAGPIALKGFDLNASGWDKQINQHKCFVLRSSPDGRITNHTLFGSSKQTYPYAITVDQQGFVFVAGSTNATDLPITSDAFDTTYNGGKWGDGWIAKFSPDLEELIFATYLGSTNSEEIWDLGVDPDGNLCIMGDTLGNDFPTSEGSFDNSYNGGEYGDGIVAKLSSDGEKLLFSTYVGGGETDMPAGLAVDKYGNILIGGLTESNDYPWMHSSPRKLIGGKQDLGISLVSSDGSTLVFSKLFGGSQNENASRFIYLEDGTIMFACNTSSPDYPMIQGAERKPLKGVKDILIGHLDENGVLISTHIIGGSDLEEMSHAFKDKSDRIVIAGRTKSKDFPTTENALDKDLGGDVDCFLIVYDIKTGNLDYSTYLGGSGDEWGMQGTAAGKDRILVSGTTRSIDFPVTDDTTFQSPQVNSGNGGGNAFMTIIDTSK